MTVELNHLIVWSKDKREGAQFLSEIMGLPPPKPFLHFLVVKLAHGLSFDFIDGQGEIHAQHYAFLVSEKEFDEIFGRIKERGLKHWADPARRLEGEINRHDGGRGVYFCDPSGHFLEIITRPYGGTA